jgi:uncharacterized protein (TIGR02145 family)
MADCSQINNTCTKGTSAVSYDSTPLPCTDVNTCDGLNTILDKFDTIICDVKESVDILTEQIIDITEDLMIITEDIINIQNQLEICCPTCDFTGTADELLVCDFTGTADQLLDCSFTGETHQVPGPTTTTTSSSTSTSTSTSTSSTSTSTTSSTSSTTTSTTTPVPTNPLSGTWDIDSVNGNVNITSINNLNGETVSCINASPCSFPIVSSGGGYTATPPTTDGATAIDSPYTAILALNISWISIVPGATYYFTIDVTGQPTVIQYISYGTPFIALNIAGITTGSEDVSILFTGTLDPVPSTTTTTTTTVPLVTICDQIWTLENLDVTTYRNGDPIPQVTDPNVWENLTTGAWCYYDNNPANGAVYGKLYNWHAVTDPRGLAPVGYHVPTEAEWQTLIETCLGGAIIAGGKMKETGFVHWDSPNTGATNSSGFTGLPGGYKDKNAASAFEYLRTVGFWWSSSLGTSSTYAWYARAYYNSDDALITQQTQEAGMSVRLIKD